MGKSHIPEELLCFFIILSYYSPDANFAHFLNVNKLVTYVHISLVEEIFALLCAHLTLSHLVSSFKESIYYSLIYGIHLAPYMNDMINQSTEHKNTLNYFTTFLER